ncbi:MAG: hypothetical protein R6V44_02825 [Paracoccaceae bacterium]
MEDLSELEASAVLMLRVCCDAAAGRPAPARFAGAEAAAFEAVTALVSAAVAGARRPLARHAAECPCVGADESAMARMVAAAAEGEREEAMLLATLIGRPEHGPELARLAERAGLELRRLALRLRRADGATIH